MIVPSGVGASHSEHVAGAVQGFRDNPALTVATHAMGTCLEGEWDVVMGAVKSATLQLHAAGVARVTTTLKAGTRTDKQGYTMAYKMQRIQDQLHDRSGTDTMGARVVDEGLADMTVRNKVQMKLSPVQSAGLDVNQTKAQLGDHALLLKAASNGDIAMLEALLQQTETLRQVNATDDTPGGALMTPLHWASKNGHPDVCEALIGAGADVNARDQFGRTAIDLAQRYGHDKVVSMLIHASKNH